MEYIVSYRSSETHEHEVVVRWVVKPHTKERGDFVASTEIDVGLAVNQEMIGGFIFLTLACTTIVL